MIDTLIFHAMKYMWEIAECRHCSFFQNVVACVDTTATSFLEVSVLISLEPAKSRIVLRTSSSYIMTQEVVRALMA